MPYHTRGEKALWWAKVYIGGIVFLFMVALYGYILNILKVAQADLDPLTTMLILRLIGVVLVPLGSVLGFL